MICYKCATPLECTGLPLASVDPEVMEHAGKAAYCPNCKTGTIDWYYKNLLNSAKVF